MSRSLPIVLLLSLAACSSPKPTNIGTEEVTEQIEEETKPEYAEPQGCMPEEVAYAGTSQMRDYRTQGQNALKDQMHGFAKACGVRDYAFDWPGIWLNAGYDADEQPSSLSDGAAPFFSATSELCAARPGEFFAKYPRVRITATSAAERIGICVDEGTQTLVYRFLLEPGGSTTQTWDAAQFAEWYGANL